MDIQEQITVNIINRNYPPGPGITGESANELAAFLVANNIAVNAIYINAFYEGNSKHTVPSGKIYSLKTFYNGKNKLLRLFANLYEGWALIKKSKSLKPDVTICLTDPPLLNFWAALMLGSKHKWMLWAMDLYPEAIVASKLISEKNIFYRWINKRLLKNPPFQFIALGDCQAAYLQDKYKHNISATVFPCGIHNITENKNSEEDTPAWATNKTKIYLGYCGNVGEAHSVTFLCAIIDNVSAEKHTLILSVYGTHAKDVIGYANNKPGITILDSVKQTHLKFIDVHLASLKEDWVNICVPSKTVTSVCAESSFLYYGPALSDNWKQLHEAGWLITPGDDVEKKVIAFLNALTREKINAKKQRAVILAQQLVLSKQEAFKEILEKIIFLSVKDRRVDYLKPKLILITNRLVIGGISNDIIPLAHYLQEDFDILILYGEKEKDEAEADFLLKKYPGLTLKKIKSFQKGANLFKDSIALFEIIKVISSFNCSIIHTHGPKSGILGRIAAYFSGAPLIVHTYHGHLFHSYYNRFYSSALLKVEKVLGRITTDVVAISAWQKKELAETYKVVLPEKITIIPLGIEPVNTGNNVAMQRTAFRKKYNVEDDAIAIGMAGRIVQIKNVGMFVETAAALINNTTKQLRFFIMGDGLLKKQIEKECALLNISYTENAGEKADIVFTSWIEDIIPAMHAMDIVALTSNNEGTPMSLIEAQWCGKPVVATNVGGVKDALIDNETGFLVPAGEVQQMANQLKLLIENDELRIQMGTKAAEFAKHTFSKQKEVENYKQLYNSLLTPKNIVHSTAMPVSIE